MTFGVYKGRQQVGFTRVITDYATYAYLSDVFILEGFRAEGLGTWLMEVIAAHPRLQTVHFWSLLTKDAHGLYEKVGFTALAAPERYMEKRILVRSG